MVFRTIVVVNDRSILVLDIDLLLWYDDVNDEDRGIIILSVSDPNIGESAGSTFVFVLPHFVH